MGVRVGGPACWRVCFREREREREGESFSVRKTRARTIPKEVRKFAFKICERANRQKQREEKV